MPRTTERPGAWLLAGLALVAAAACAPAGLRGGSVPAASWGVWAATFALALAGFARAGLGPASALRRLAWALPAVAMLALPAGLWAGPARGPALVAALASRALAATAAAGATAAVLGPLGLVAAARAVRAPARFVDVLASALASLVVVRRQATSMLRARAARRPGHGAWGVLARSPRATARGFGRLVAALLLRSLERAEALERARRARGVGL